MSGGRRTSALDLEAAARQLFDSFKEEEDEDGERLFEEASLLRLCAEKGLDLPKARVSSIFADIKAKKKTHLSFERFQNALGKIAEALGKSNEALLTDLAGNQEDPAEVQPPSVAGERGPIKLFLPVNKKFKQRFAVLRMDPAPLLCIVGKPGATPKDEMTLKLAQAVIDRMPDMGKANKGRASRLHSWRLWGLIPHSPRAS